MNQRRGAESSIQWSLRKRWEPSNICRYLSSGILQHLIYWLTELWQLGTTGQVEKVAERDLKVVRLIEPELCYNCRFAERAKVEFGEGQLQAMVYCRRLDCDNWDTQTFEAAENVILESDSEAA